jgi:hypothetical protein
MELSGVFGFPVLEFPSVSRLRVSFLLESVKVCQRYFCFSLQHSIWPCPMRRGITRNCTEIRHGPAKVDVAPSPHFFSRDEGVASTHRRQKLLGAEEMFAKATGFRWASGVRKHVRQSDGVVP